MSGEAFWRDIKFGLRGLARNRAFAAVALVTLGLGIGANTAVFSVVNAVILRPLPYPGADRIAIIYKTEPKQNLRNGATSPPEFLDWRSRTHTFEQLGAWAASLCNVAGTREPQQVLGAHVSSNFFEVFQLKPALGRFFLPEEEEPGREREAVLSFSFWQQHFGGDKNVLGRIITVENVPYTIIGVLPPEFNLWGNIGRQWQYDVWMPYAFDRGNLDRNQHLFIVFGRLKQGVPLTRASTELADLVEQIKKENPGVDPNAGVRADNLHDARTRRVRPSLEIVLACSVVVLLIACVNLANLLLSRATSREREMAVRASLGAGRGRLLVQLLTESVLLALSGGVFGLLLAFAGLRLLPFFLPAADSLYEMPYAANARIDLDVLLFALLASLATGVLFGLAPALQLSRARLGETLKEGGRGSSGGRAANHVRNFLVVAEMAVSLLLLAGAGLLTRSFLAALSENLGYNPDHLLTLQVLLPDYKYRQPVQFISFYRQLEERVKTLPGVRSVAMINYLPLTAWSIPANFEVAGRGPQPRSEQFIAHYRVVDSGYTSTMEIPVLQGRAIGPGDAEQGPGVALINSALAAKFFPNEDPVGKQIRFLQDAGSKYAPVLQKNWLTIVGVVGDTVELRFGDPKSPEFYLPYLQNPSALMHIVLRTDSEPGSLAEAVRRAVQELDPEQPVSDVKLMDDYVAVVSSLRRMNMSLVAFFALLATGLAGVGIFGVMSYSVTQQTHDLGIRLALGAQPRDVLRLVVHQGMRLALVGIFLGLLAAVFVLERALSAVLFGLSARDPMVLAGTVALLAAIAFAACYLPARRATRVDPLAAIHYE